MRTIAGNEDRQELLQIVLKSWYQGRIEEGRRGGLKSVCEAMNKYLCIVTPKTQVNKNQEGSENYFYIVCQDRVWLFSKP